MDIVKKYGSSLLNSLLVIFVSTFLLTIFYYFNLLNNAIFKGLKVFIPILGLLWGGFKIGKNSKEKGYLQGIKFGFVFLFFLLILSHFILKNSFKLKLLIYYLIIILAPMLGSMIGINKKKEETK